MNQYRTIPLSTRGVELNAANLAEHSEEIYFNVFDEVEIESAVDDRVSTAAHREVRASSDRGQSRVPHPPPKCDSDLADSFRFADFSLQGFVVSSSSRNGRQRRRGQGGKCYALLNPEQREARVPAQRCPPLQPLSRGEEGAALPGLLRAALDHGVRPGCAWLLVESSRYVLLPRR